MFGKIRLTIIFFVIILGVLTAVIWLLALEYDLKKSQPFTPPANESNIALDSPPANDSLNLPIFVTGDARVFENVVSFSVTDESGRILNKGFTNANSPDIGQFGNFSYKINSLESEPSSDQLIIKVYWDSPEDGAPLDTVTVPVYIDKSKHRTTKLFFSNSHEGGSDCSAVFPVTRYVGLSQTPAEDAISMLLRDILNSAEREAGYFSSLPGNVRLNSLNLKDGFLTVDFSEELNQVGGSCRVTSIRSQITSTLKQFTTIKDVIITVNGRADTALQP